MAGRKVFNKSSNMKKKAKSVTEDISIENKEESQSSFFKWRFVWGIGIVILCTLALLYKTLDIQVLDSERLIKEANSRSLRTQELPYTRGKILDRHGRVLSISVPVYSITIDPKSYFEHRLKRKRATWRALAMEVGGSASKISSNVDAFLKEQNKMPKDQRYDPREILNTQSEGYWTLLSQATGLDYSLLISKVRHNPNSQFLRLEQEAERLAKEKMQAFAKISNKKYADIMADLYKKSSERFASLARHQTEEVANYVRELDFFGVVIRTETRRVYPRTEEISQLIGFTDREDKQGMEGLERNFNSLLVGKSGKQLIRQDKSRNIVENIRTENPYDPQDVVLSIDEELQSMVYSEIKQAVSKNKAESGTAVLIDIRTGEVLAMANAPSFNPNNRANLKPADIRNRAITDTFEPGSTVKPLVILTALQHGVTYKDEIVNTRPFLVNGHTIKDVSSNETLSLQGILQKSSNTGVSRLALRMPSTALVETYSRVGFGKDTGLGLGEQRGSNGDRKRWSDIERATLSYGYGLNVTPLQLARAYATLGSFGIYRPLSITKVDPPVIGERVLPEKTTRDVVAMMETVAHKGQGGARAAVEGYTVAVKTGTARKLENGQYVEKYVAFTAGIAPASDPRFALVVLINEPKSDNYYGGAVSAPLFSKIMGYTLKSQNIKPDNLTDNRSAVREIKPSATN